MKKLKKVYDKWAESNRQLFKESKQYILACLEKTPSKEVEIDWETNVCVTYDGGRHPEYDANPFSQVERVYLENGEIYLETEDTTQYNICNINACELFNVAEAVGATVAND